MKENKIDVRQNQDSFERFEMPPCEFCAKTCGNCMYYGTENLSGYCELHRKNVSSSWSGCASHEFA